MSAETKTRILESALAVFAERGADGGSMREVARRAGVNVATAYHHFGSKRELFLAIFREVGFVDTPVAVDEWPPEGGTPQESLEAILFGAWILMRGGSDVLRLAVAETMKGDEEVQAVFEVWQEQGDERIVQMLMRTGLANEQNAKARAWVVRQVIWATFIEELQYRPWSDEELTQFARDTSTALLEGGWA